MENAIELFKVLSDETRLRIINLISNQNLCVCELVEILNLSQPKISKHIARLRQINLVNTERNEQFIYYSLNKDNKAYTKMIGDILANLDDYPLLQKDIERLNKVENFVCTRVN